MADRSRDLVLNLTVRDKTTGELKKVEGRLDTSGKRFRQFADVAKLALAGGVAREVIGVAKQLDDMGTVAESVRDRFNTVFGDMADEMRQWADQQNEAFGVSVVQMENLAAGVQDLLVPLGFARKDAADMTQKILTLANALSEWTGGQISVEDATDRLRKALLGEREGLKELGVKISEADVKSQLLKDGTDNLTGSALEQAKAQATLELMYARSSDALTQYANNADSAIRQNKQLAATSADLKQQLADFLKPTFDDARDGAGDLAEILMILNEAMGNTGDTAGDAAKQGQSFTDAITSSIPGLNLVLPMLSNIADKHRDARIESEKQATWVKELAGGYQQLADRAHETASDGVDPLTESLASSRREYEEMLDTLGSTNPYKEYGDVLDVTVGKLDDFKSAVEETAQSMVDAFSPVPDQIDTTLGEITSNLNDWVISQRQWEDGLAELAARGGLRFADELRQQGIKSLDVLEEALADPAGARAVEYQLAVLGGKAAESFATGFDGWISTNLAIKLEQSLSSAVREAVERLDVGGDLWGDVTEKVAAETVVSSRSNPPHGVQ